MNCSALAESLLESELFGHVKGAFTGAIANKIGRFELADGGTIFLDEIGDISPLIQLKLLRVLETHEFERVGHSKPTRVDVRILAATNKDLWKRVSEGQFRDDLYYRLKVVTIHLPPLRDRRDDVPLLVEHFVNKFRTETGKAVEGPTPEAMAAFMNYHSPGNIRELENAIEHAFVCCPGGCFGLDDLPEEIRAGRLLPPGSAIRSGGGALHGSIMEAERSAIINALGQTNGNLAKAAWILGIARNTLWRKMRQYNLGVPDPRRSQTIPGCETGVAEASRRRTHEDEKT